MAAGTTSIRAGRAFVELFADDSKLVRGLKRAQAKLRAFGKSIRDMGLKVAAAGSSVVTALLGSAKLYSSMGDQIAKMARRTGLSVETVSELAVAADLSGASVQDLENGIRRMQRTLLDAAQGTKTAEDALAMLGLSVEQLRGLNPEQQFKVLADRLDRIADPTTKAALAMELFGRSGTMLLPMLAGGAAGIEELQRQARRLGLTLSTADAEGAERLTDALALLWRSVKRVTFAVGAALAKDLTAAAEAAMRFGASIARLIDRNRQAVVLVLKVALAVTALGAALVGLGVTIQVVAFALGGLTKAWVALGAAVKLVAGLLSAVLSPVGLVIAAVAALGAAILHFTGWGAKALAWLGQRFGVLRDDAVSAWGGIADALAAGDIGLAAKVLWLTLKMEWTRGVNALLAVWQRIKAPFQEAWADIVYGSQVVWVEFTSFLRRTWIRVVAGLQTAWAKFTAWHARTVESTANWIAKRWMELQSLFDDTIDVEFARKYIDQQSAGRMSEIAGREKQDLDRIRSEKDQDLQDTERRRQERLRKIVEADAEAERKRAEAARQQLAGAEDELARAREEWRKALAEAKAARGAKDDGGPGRPPGVPELDFDGIEQAVRRTVGLVGTFNVANLAALQAGGGSDRLARSSKATAANTKRLVDMARQGGLVFEP